MMTKLLPELQGYLIWYYCKRFSEIINNRRKINGKEIFYTIFKEKKVIFCQKHFEKNPDFGFDTGKFHGFLMSGFDPGVKSQFLIPVL
jgi:hypothetical protein